MIPATIIGPRSLDHAQASHWLPLEKHHDPVAEKVEANAPKKLDWMDEEHSRGIEASFGGGFIGFLNKWRCAMWLAIVKEELGIEV